jgi:hypothetical protein
MTSTSVNKVEQFIIPAYDFYLFGISKQKSVEEQEEYIKDSVQITGEEEVRSYLVRHLKANPEDEDVQTVFRSILSNEECLSKVDIVSDGSYRCNRLLFNPYNNKIKLSGGNTSDLDNKFLGANKYHAYYPLTEEGVNDWINGNERLFIQECYESPFMDFDFDYDHDNIADSHNIEEDRLSDRGDWYDLEEVGDASVGLVLSYVKGTLESGLIPYYSDSLNVSGATIEEYNDVLRTNGYEKYVF